jgi:hypothetical protein
MDTSFERNKTGKDEWLTPPELIRALGKFDLDPCSPVKRPWDTATKHFTLLDNGLTKPWTGRVWCNPPYGSETNLWLDKCVAHGNCIALTFARTETKMFFEQVWSKADAVLFLKGRIRFYHSNGTQGDSAGAPSVLIAYGVKNAEILEKSKLNGKFIWVKKWDKLTLL